MREIRTSGATRGAGELSLLPPTLPLKKKLADGDEVYFYCCAGGYAHDGDRRAGRWDYVVTGRFARQHLSNLSRELGAILSSTIALFEGFDDDMLLMRGRASGSEFTVRALAYLICGREIHHKRILRERYL